MDIDKPLEEIIAASKPKGRGGRPARGLPKAAPAATRDRYASNVPRNAPRGGPNPPVRAAGPDAYKIIISNLPADVTEAAVRDLMQSTVGPVKNVQMSFTSSGKSAGQATVLFKNRGDANKAHASYHNRMVDNQRPMKVEIAVDMSTLQSLATRVAPAPARALARAGAGGKPPGGKPRGGAAGTRPAKRQQKTAEELDAEMSAYKDTA